MSDGDLSPPGTDPSLRGPEYARSSAYSREIADWYADRKRTQGQRAAPGTLSNPSSTERQHHHMSNNHGIPASALPPGADASYVDQMVARAEQGGATFDTPAQAEFTPPAAPEFRTKFGSTKAAAAATANDLLIYKSGDTVLEIEAAQAVAMGLIRPAAGGGYEAISTVEREMAEKAHREVLQQEQQQASAEIEEKRKTGDEPDQGHQATVDRLNAIVPAKITNDFIDDYIRSGTISLRQVHGAARAIGIDAEAAEGLSMDLYEGFRRQADLAVSTQGVPAHEAEALYAWASQHHPVDARNAVRALVLASDAKALKALALKYAAARREGREG